jgi:hypothetical protein
MTGYTGLSCLMRSLHKVISCEESHIHVYAFNHHMYWTFYGNFVLWVSTLKADSTISFWFKIDICFESIISFLSLHMINNR